MDTDGNGFFSSWNDYRKDLKTDEFKQEFDEVINSLREEGDILHNRKDLAYYCYTNPQSKMPTEQDYYGVRVDTDKYTYLLRLNPNKGEYNLYCYCYVNTVSAAEQRLSKLIKDNDLPPVVFHSIRHSSITYKLKWTEGDIKSVQGDSGHARADMVADVYSHILDEDRAINAQRFDEKFYGNPSPSDGMSDDPPAEQPQGVLSMQEMLMGVLTNPEMSKAFQEFFLQQQASSKAAT